MSVGYGLWGGQLGLWPCSAQPSWCTHSISAGILACHCLQLWVCSGSGAWPGACPRPLLCCGHHGGSAFCQAYRSSRERVLWVFWFRCLAAGSAWCLIWVPDVLGQHAHILKLLLQSMHPGSCRRGWSWGGVCKQTPVTPATPVISKRSADPVPPPHLRLNIILLMALPGGASCHCSLLLDIALLLFRNTTCSVLSLLECV